MNRMAPHSLTPELKVHDPPLQGALTESMNHPSCVPSFHQNPALTLPVSRLFFKFQAQKWVSKLQILRASAIRTCTVPLGRVSPHFCHSPACPRKVVTCGLAFTAKQSGKPPPTLTVLSQLPGSYAWEECSTLVSPILLATQGIFRPHCHSWHSAPLCTWAPLISQAHPPW